MLRRPCTIFTTLGHYRILERRTLNREPKPALPDGPHRLSVNTHRSLERASVEKQIVSNPLDPPADKALHRDTTIHRRSKPGMIQARSNTNTTTSPSRCTKRTRQHFDGRNEIHETSRRTRRDTPCLLGTHCICGLRPKLILPAL